MFKMDKLSNLPPGVIETILCFLPIQEAARTSILSREWRYRWIRIPKLAFMHKSFEVLTDGAELSVLEQTFDEPSERKEMSTTCKLFYAIYQVLLVHEGPIHEFTLSMVANRSCVEIDHIIRYLLKKSTLKVLKLDFCGTYALPLSLFSLHGLRELHLSGRVPDPLPSSIRFGSLTTLYLQEIHISEKELMRLLTSCPVLKRLTIMSDGGTITDRGESTIADLFECFRDIEYLSFMFFIFTCFSPNRLPKKVSTTLVHLKHISIEWVWFRQKYSVPFLVLLSRTSPNLEKLTLQMSVYDDLFDESVTSSFILEDYSDITLERLKELEILNFCNFENDFMVVKLLLTKSPVLKNVRILLWDEFDKDEELDISRTILSFSCASPVVKLTFS